MTGKMMTTSHAPSVNFAIAKMDDDQAGDAGRQIEHDLRTRARAALALEMSGHAKSGHREAGENADRVERHERVHLGIGRDKQYQRGNGEHDDRVGEDQPMPTSA